MIKHGVAPYFECSSKGDLRFSAFGARIRSMGNRQIEAIYQGAKVFSDGSTNLHWRDAKAKGSAVNQESVVRLYGELWDLYLEENPELIHVITAQPGLSDCFGQPGHACQATELWRIRCAAMGIENHEEEKEEPLSAQQSLFDM
jgi:hypothetical protein